MTELQNTMEEVTFSKKQLTPFITKNNINVETDELFKSIIRLFKDSPNYHLWALKLVYSGVLKFDGLVELKKWLDENHQLIQKLAKKNVVAYSTQSDMAQLHNEIAALNKWACVKRNVDKFNTEQRKIWGYFFGETPANGIVAASNARLMHYADKFKVFECLSKEKQHNFITKSSAYRDVNDLVHAFDEALLASWDWYREALLTFVKTVTPDTEVVYDDHNIVILEIKSFESSKATCGGTKTSWCITRDNGHFRNYVGDHKNEHKQYFMFNFDLNETDDLAMVGFTVHKNNGIIYAHTVKNNDIRSESSYTYKGERLGISKWLTKNKVPFSVVMTAKPLSAFVWTKASVLKSLKSNDETVTYDKDNLLVIRVSTSSLLSKYIGHTYINTNSLSVNASNPIYIIMDFNKDYNADDALMVLVCEADEYGTESVTKGINFYNVYMDKSEVYQMKSVTERDIIKNLDLDPSVLLHKYVDDNDEDAALELIENGSADINHLFNNRHIVFTAIHRGMDRLFEKIINDGNFNPNLKDAYGEIILTHLSFSYIFCEDNLTEKFENMIKSVMRNKRFDLNLANDRGETFLSLSSACECCNWFTSSLIANPNININKESEVDTSAMSEAIRNHNMEIVNLLGQRPDLTIGKSVNEACEEMRFNVKDVIKPNSNFFNEHKNEFEVTSEAVASESIPQLSEEEKEILKRVCNISF